MCLAISKPAGAKIPLEHLQNGYDGNPMGCGFCYSENGKLTVVKGLFSFKEFYDQYKEKEKFPMLVHFRLATHAGENILNCHPFSICDGKYALIHNGIIPIHCTIKELSDTGNFAKLVMEPMLKAGVNPRKPAFVFLVEQAVGRGNKIALMASNGDVVIYNEDSGDYEDADGFDGKPLLDAKGQPLQVWYSNCGYKYRRQIRRSYMDEFEGCFAGRPRGGHDVEPTTGGTVFTNRARLDPPPGRTIEGFRAGVGSAAKSAQAIVEAYGGQVPTITRNGKYPPNGSPNIKKQTVKILLPSGKPVTTTEAPAPVIDISNHKVLTVESGPIFDVKDECEIEYLVSTMNMTREKAIEMLGLTDKDAIKYVA